MSQPQNSADTGRMLKRRLTSTSDLPFFTPSADSFKPKPYYSHATSSVPRIYRTSASYRAYHRESYPQKPFDPTPDDPTAVFIHPPFEDFPDADLHPEGLTYTLMAENPEWFLDPTDFKGEADPNPNAIVYPTFLEPPRGWCPTKKKDIKVKRLDGTLEEDTPTLRCTFCRRRYAGVNAKSMWRRHVLEKHKIPMSNRRDGPGDSGRSGRAANKENKKVSSTPSIHCGLQHAKSDIYEPLLGSGACQPLLPPFGGFGMNVQPIPSKLRELCPADDVSKPFDALSPPSASSHHGDGKQLLAAHGSPQLQGSMLPPSSPPVNISSSLKSAPQASPFDPLKTPNIGHVLRQPWKFPSPSHPLHVGPDELCLGVPVRGIAGEGLKGGYIPNHSSPFSLPHTSPTKLFSSPTADASPLSRRLVTGRILGWKRSSSGSIKLPLPESPVPEVRRPAYTGPLPVPVTERFGIETPEHLPDLDEFDVTFSSLDESFMSWFDMTSAFGSPSNNSVKIVDPSSAYPDTPVKRSTDVSLSDHAQLVVKSSSSSWISQPSGVGLGITMPSTDFDGDKELVVRDDHKEELFYSPTQSVSAPVDSPSTDDEWSDPRASGAPPLKRRRTM